MQRIFDLRYKQKKSPEGDFNILSIEQKLFS